DVGDNLGGGTPGDGTFLLAELLAQGARGAVVTLCDPEAVGGCQAAGVGGELTLAVGGKQDAFHGSPVTLTGRVVALTDGVFRNVGPMRDGIVDDQGPTAVLEVACGRLLLTSQRLANWNLEQLRAAGIEPTQQRIIVCKGALAHRAAYQPIAAELIDVDTAGLTPADYRKLPFEQVRRPLFRFDPQVAWGAEP
ncbi:MAG: MlrC C-terminal domain-containing protein, partial [Armatimonadetes bacterium]|nr:MlrC C-terminal domain-containing protein [Armatimonadota bacterium]